MHFHVITLFPKAFDSYLGESILKRAIEDKKVRVSFYNPRDFVPRHRSGPAAGKSIRIDKPPYGGGPGMVIQALPVIKAIEAAFKKTRNKKQETKIIWLSPSGKQFDNKYAAKTAKKSKHVVIVCGRYEGIDARVKKAFKMEEVSMGPYILTGGELPAMAVMDAVARQLPGVLGNIESVEERRVAGKDVYTRPEVFEYPPPGRGKKSKKYRVPKILLSGHRAKIEELRRKNAHKLDN